MPDGPAAEPVRVAPKESEWNGEAGEVKPWEHRVTVTIPHLDTLPQLTLAVDLWRCQTVRPFIQIHDTGSPWSVVEQLEKLRAPDLEIHYTRAHAYRHSSAPVTAALDHAQTLCRTRHLFHTHSDVFPIRRDFLAWMIGQCDERTPVVGWQMSSRSGTEEWRHCVSHTATMLHAPTVRLKALWWTMERHYDQYPNDRKETMGWPDTESPFLHAMRAAGVVPKLFGPEKNYQRHQLTADGIAWVDHARSFSGLKLTPDDPRWAKARAYMAEAEADACSRLAEWRKSDAH